MSWNGMHVIVITALLFSVVGVRAADDSQLRNSEAADEAEKAKTNEIADQIFYREAKFVQDLKPLTPMVETYIQEMKGNEELGRVPSSDKYFIGRLVMKKGIENVSFQKNSSSILQKLDSFYKMNYDAAGFMQMIYIPGFDKSNYELKYLHQEFLGEIRTLVFEVEPKPRVKGAHFLG